MRVFVFGSNQKGIHGAGTAKVAVERYGAQRFVGEGRTGNAYAIPTKSSPYVCRQLTDIKRSVDAFIEYANAHPTDVFHVVQIGCGLAGFTNEQMGPLFTGAPDNCYFSPNWGRYGLRTWEEEPYDSQ